MKKIILTIFLTMFVTVFALWIFEKVRSPLDESGNDVSAMSPYCREQYLNTRTFLLMRDLREGLPLPQANQDVKVTFKDWVCYPDGLLKSHLEPKK
jgi:hypothetical protein